MRTHGQPPWALAGLPLFVLLPGCVTTSTPPEARERYQVETSTTDQFGRTVSSAPQDLSRQVWGLGPGLGGGSMDPTLPVPPETSAPADPQDPKKPPKAGEQQKTPDAKQDPTVPSQASLPLDAQRAAAIRARFGANVIVRPDGRVTKQYVLGAETGSVFLMLLAEPGMGDPKAPPPTGPAVVGGEQSTSQSVLAQMLGGREVELVYFEKFEEVRGTNVVVGFPFPAANTPSGFSFINSMVLVTANVEGLAAFEDALNLFFAYTPQVEIEIKVVEYTTSAGLFFGVAPTSANTPIFSNLSSKALVKSISSAFPLNPGVTGSGSNTDRGTFTLGGIHDRWELSAQLQALETQNIVDIISRPKMVVRNGGSASVITSTKIPYPKARITSSGQNVVADIEFRDVGVKMNIRPVIAGTETVILEIHAEVSAVTGFARTEPVDTPIISSRSATTSVHVPNDKTTVIGGLSTISTFDTESKVPLLGDIPLLGFLFRATSTARQETQLEFHITPRIIEGHRGFQRNP